MSEDAVLAAISQLGDQVTQLGKKIDDNSAHGCAFGQVTREKHKGLRVDHNELAAAPGKSLGRIYLIVSLLISVSAFLYAVFK